MGNWGRGACWIGLFALLGLSPSNALAGLITVRIDAIPGNGAGVVDATRTVTIGENFSVDILVTLTTDTTAASLGTYGVSVQYDTLPLDLNPVGNAAAALESLPTQDVFGVSFPAPGGAFAFNFTSGVHAATESVNGNPGKGQVSTFEAGTLSNGPDTTNKSPITFLVGSVNFTATASGTSVVTPGTFNTGSDGFFDNGYAEVSPTFHGASITVAAVPEPSSLLLMGAATTAFLGGYTRRRWKNNRRGNVSH